MKYEIEVLKSVDQRRIPLAWAITEGFEDTTNPTFDPFEDITWFERLDADFVLGISEPLERGPMVLSFAIGFAITEAVREMQYYSWLFAAGARVGDYYRALAATVPHARHLGLWTACGRVLQDTGLQTGNRRVWGRTHNTNVFVQQGFRRLGLRRICDCGPDCGVYRTV